MDISKKDLIERLAIRSIKLAGKSTNEIERFCWMTVHEHHHGVMPSEYDIREIDEDLYLAILRRVKEFN
tara:strand:+ start:821 stop:1027 length:207 start_codon:yes stop_codon:yes gene_type:complete